MAHLGSHYRFIVSFFLLPGYKVDIVIELIDFGIELGILLNVSSLLNDITRMILRILTFKLISILMIFKYDILVILY